MATSQASSHASRTPQPGIIDDKSSHCIPFILSLLQDHNSRCPSTPFIVGLNGIQGVGKTTLVTALAEQLTARNIKTLVLSIDDLYLTHADQLSLAASTTPRNPLLQHRGEPGTHDMALAATVLPALRAGEECAIPAYDKSAHQGQGDRIPRKKWQIVNRPGEKKIQIIILEGWCVGFHAISVEEVREKREAPSKTLGKHRFEDLAFVNERLRDYEVLTATFDAFIHIDAMETEWVYEWREEQEVVLRRQGRGGMTTAEVVRFVDGYYPAYELYSDDLRQGVFQSMEDMHGRQLRLIVGRDRRVTEVLTI